MKLLKIQRTGAPRSVIFRNLSKRGGVLKKNVFVASQLPPMKSVKPLSASSSPPLKSVRSFSSFKTPRKLYFSNPTQFQIQKSQRQSFNSIQNQTYPSSKGWSNLQKKYSFSSAKIDETLVERAVRKQNLVSAEIRQEKSKNPDTNNTNNNNTNNNNDENNQNKSESLNDQQLISLLKEINFYLYSNLLKTSEARELYQKARDRFPIFFQKHFGVPLMDVEQWKSQLEKLKKEELRTAMRNLLTVLPFDPTPEITSKIETILTHEFQSFSVTDAQQLPRISSNPKSLLNKIAIWRGDITVLKVDAIVNAANSQMLGCFTPGHLCIDNVIHAKAGPKLRAACREIMEKQETLEKTGEAKITPAFQLPSKYVLHTVGPIIRTLRPSEYQEKQLSSSYISCIKSAIENKARSIAFCCISTGVFGYPQKEACQNAFETVLQELKVHGNDLDLIVFNVWKPEDLTFYQQYAKQVLERDEFKEKKSN